MCLCAYACLQVGVERLWRRLKTIRWLPINGLTFSMHWHGAHLETVRAQLAVLQGVNPCDRAAIELVGFPMTLNVMGVLRCLPEWTGALHFKQCTWPLEPPEMYSMLAQHVPTSFKQWVLLGDVSSDVVEQVCEGASECRDEVRSVLNVLVKPSVARGVSMSGFGEYVHLRECQ